MSAFVQLARMRVRGSLPSPLARRGVDIVPRPEPSGAPDMRSFDLIVVSSSGGNVDAGVWPSVDGWTM